MDVMDPNHISLLLYLNQVQRKLLVHLTISVPHLGILLVDFIFVISFEIVEEWSQELLIEEHKLFNLVLFQPDRITILALKKFLNHDFFFFVLRDDSRPSNPLEVEKSLLFQSKDGWIEHGPTLFETQTSIV